MSYPERQKPETPLEYLARVGRKGGKAKSKRKYAAVLANLEKALAKRWGRPYHLKPRKLTAGEK